MPGSVTASHHSHAAAVGHADAERLVAVLAELGRMIETTGPERLDDAQLAALRGDHAQDRTGMSAWTRQVAAELSSQLHHGLGHA
ncbi:hypothetical protein [Yinghuangia sp. YIM S09857]|uniref:hypothetical protein n=1 Tax=Yinghuangia sp. YIM S09857 TaxID=3436929 RepID=UPI003F53029E